jgi:conjugal transfer pilus assembly protein TraB
MKSQEEDLQDSKTIKKQQFIRVAYGIIAMALVVYGYDFVVDMLNPPAVSTKVPEPKISVEVAAERLDGGKIWFNNLDQRLEKEIEQRKTYAEQQKELFENLEKKVSKQDSNSEIELLKEQLSWLKKELQETDRKVNERKEETSLANNNYAGTAAHKIGGIESFNASSEQYKDADNYIPAGSFVSGILRGGISASTGVGAPAEPPPIFIRVTGIGDMPKNFKIDLTKCRIVVSGYGQVANERIVARVETLSCTSSKTGKVIETQIAGVVHGTDSKNGIKGTVVSMAGKHLKNAAIGGIISGFAGTGKSDNGFMFNPSLGAISAGKPSIKDKITDSMSQGASNAAEKMADYHMKMAEASAPVVEVPGAVPVTVFFSKGVYLGSVLVKEEIKHERK